MTLIELLDAAYRSEYIVLDDLDEIKKFAKRWKMFLTWNLEDIPFMDIPRYGMHPITGQRVRMYTTTYKDLLKDEYKYLLE